MRPTTDLVAHLGRLAFGGWIELVEEHVVGVLGVGLDVARVAAEQLAHGGAGLVRHVLEEHVVTVGDHHEEVPAAARLARAGRRGLGLDADARRVRGDAERGLEGMPLGGECHTAHGHAEVLHPPAHRAAIEVEALAREALLLTIQRQPVAVLVDGDLRQQRRRGQKPRERPRRHRRGGDRLARDALDAVLGACDDDAHGAGLAPAELDRLLEADALGLAFERGVEQLVALLGERQRAHVAPPLGFGLGSVRLRGRRGGWRRGGRLGRVGRGRGRVGRGRGRGIAELVGERVELRLLLGELQLELPRVDALGRGHEDALAEQLELEQGLVIGGEQPRMVGGEPLGAGVLGLGASVFGLGASVLGLGTRALGGERGLGGCEASPQLFARRLRTGLASHGPGA